MSFVTRTLGEICDEVDGLVQTGPFGSQLHRSDYRDEGTPVVMPKDLVGSKVSVESIARIGDKDVSRLSRHKLKEGDIVYARRGDIGRRALITEHEAGWMCGTGCMRISLGDSVVHPVFLHYYLGQPDIVTWIYNQAVGATMPNLNTSIVRSIPITYPPLPTQRKIAAILSAYDDLIENNTRRIALLEHTAQLLYREWFVHFRFPGHESVPLVESELGPIPEGWEVATIGDLYATSSGGTPSRKVNEYFGGEVNWIKTRELKDGFIFDTEEKITALGLQKSSAKLFPTNTVVIAMYGATIGQLGILASPSATNQACCALLPKIPPFDHRYAFLCLLQNRSDLINLRMGAAQQNINQQVIKGYQIFEPCKSIVHRFNDCVEPIFGQIQVLQRKNQTLRQTRDLLLPRLISGQLDVSELEILTGEFSQ